MREYEVPFEPVMDVKLPPIYTVDAVAVIALTVLFAEAVHKGSSSPLLNIWARRVRY